MCVRSPYSLNFRGKSHISYLNLSSINILILHVSFYSIQFILPDELKKIKLFTFSSSDFGASYTDIEYTIGPIPELLLLLLFQTELSPYSTKH